MVENIQLNLHRTYNFTINTYITIINNMYINICCIVKYFANCLESFM